MSQLSSKSLFIKRALQKYPVNETIIKARPGLRSLPEMIMRFPKYGLGMKVWKKTWPNDSFY